MKSEKLFDTLYSMTKEQAAVARKPLVERELKRSFEKAYDEKLDEKIKLENEINSMQEDIKKYDMRKYIQCKESIKNCTYTMDAIADHYKEMFGEEFTRVTVG